MCSEEPDYEAAKEIEVVDQRFFVSSGKTEVIHITNPSPALLGRLRNYYHEDIIAEDKIRAEWNKYFPTN